MATNDLRNPMTAGVDGMRPLQDELQRLTLATATGPGGEMRNNLLLALLQLQRYALGIVHVDTGRLKNSIFTDLETVGNDLMGHVATNVEYAIFEEMRAGSKGVYGGHNFFGRTVREEGPNVVENSIFRPVTMGGR
jgi:hypothetical protein